MGRTTGGVVTLELMNLQSKKQQCHTMHQKLSFKSLWKITALMLFSHSMDLSAAENKDNEKLELETLRIQGNKELPRVLFVVPWQSKKKRRSKKEEHQLVLHSLYGDLFDPVNPTQQYKNNK